MQKNTTYCPRYNYAKLRGKIKEVFGKEYAFAEKLGRTQNYLVRVWNGYTYFTHADIDLAIQLLGIDSAEIADYFFMQLNVTT